MSSTTQSSDSPQTQDKILRDILLWRKKKQSVSVLAVATVTWVVLEIYQINFITFASWVAMAVVILMFLWGNLLKFLGKEPPNMSEIENSEQTAFKMGITMKMYVEEGLRWMLRLSTESEWYVFAGTVGALWILSIVGSSFDLPTFLYIVTVLGSTVPVIYEKYEHKIKEFWEGARAQGRRWCAMVDEKLLKKIKNKVVIEKRDRDKVRVDAIGEVDQKDKKVE